MVNDRKGRRGRSGRKGWLWRLTGNRYRSRQRKSNRVAGLSNGVYRVGKRERKKEKNTYIMYEGPKGKQREGEGGSKAA